MRSLLEDFILERRLPRRLLDSTSSSKLPGEGEARVWRTQTEITQIPLTTGLKAADATVLIIFVMDEVWLAGLRVTSSNECKN